MAYVSAPRHSLIEAGVRILERDGLPALSARNVAAETGTSTMAVYTHFGGMTGLLDAIAGEVFIRFTRALTEVPETDDPWPTSWRWDSPTMTSRSPILSDTN